VTPVKEEESSRKKKKNQRSKKKKQNVSQSAKKNEQTTSKEGSESLHGPLFKRLRMPLLYPCQLFLLHPPGPLSMPKQFLTLRLLFQMTTTLSILREPKIPLLRKRPILQSVLWKKKLHR
jgi:hypothetical protein